MNIVPMMRKSRTPTLAKASQAPKARRSHPPRKALGQYYLVDRDILQSIVSASELDPDDTVVEVGPGPGALTRQLVQRVNRVIAIEVDPNLAASLPQRLGHPPNLTTINADARRVDLAQVLAGTEQYKVVANLPYYAANPILRRFLEAEGHRPSLMVVMLQREVANSMVAAEGRMSLLAIAIQLYGVPRIVCDVPPSAFFPPPKVTSSVVRIDVRRRPAIEVEDVQGFFDVVRAGYSAPRKQLRNSLSLGLNIPAEGAERLLAQAEVDPKCRAESLSLDDWGRVCSTVRAGSTPVDGTLPTGAEAGSWGKSGAGPSRGS